MIEVWPDIERYVGYYMVSNLGRNYRGENSVRSKLTDKDVIEIRKSNLPYKELAVMFNVNRSCICKIKIYRRWRHI